MKKNAGFRSDSKVGHCFSEIVDLYLEGWSTQRIGQKFGIDPSNIYRALKSRGIKLRNRPNAIRLAVKIGVLKHSSGKDHRWWKGGRCYHSAGYILLRKPNHPRADCRGYVPEHVLVIEEMLQRTLNSDEIVHHRNYDKKDNHPENLQVMTCIEHGKIHGIEGANAKWNRIRR